MNSSSEDEGDQIMSLDRAKGTVLSKYLSSLYISAKSQAHFD